MMMRMRVMIIFFVKCLTNENTLSHTSVWIVVSDAPTLTWTIVLDVPALTNMRHIKSRIWTCAKPKFWLYIVEPFFTPNNHLNFLFKTAIDGGYSEWSDWTECSVSCGRGTEERERQCNNPLPSGGGKDCEEFGPATEIKQCQVRECPGMLH